MKIKVITTSDRLDHPGWHKLQASLDYFKYDYQHILAPFAFGHQMPHVLAWCQAYQGDCTHILYTDCFDTVAFGGPHEVKAKWLMYEEADSRIKMLISGEKACFPYASRAVDYPETSRPWKYVNGGGWMVEIDYFINLCLAKQPLTLKDNDQAWLMECFLKNQDQIKIDYDCWIFQSIAFSNLEEWALDDNRFVNVGTGTKPVFFHGNGRTTMDWVYLQHEKQLKHDTSKIS